MKKQFSGLYKTAREIPPKQLLEYYLKGDSQERREAKEEVLRRLRVYDEVTKIISSESMSFALAYGHNIYYDLVKEALEI